MGLRSVEEWLLSEAGRMLGGILFVRLQLKKPMMGTQFHLSRNKEVLISLSVACLVLTFIPYQTHTMSVAEILHNFIVAH